jgi:cyclopropane fatty-acyl-phospholipid synthase-like methyltransferase
MEILFGLVSIFFILGLAYILGVFKGAPFLPTTQAKVEQMILAAKILPGERLADIGSGDGRILIAAAKAGAIAHGYEINPFLIWWSRIKIRQAGLSDRAFVHWKNFWLQDLSEYDIITVFGITNIMPDLEKKLQKELQPGARVICNIFPFPNWPRSENKEVYLYKKTLAASRREFS